MTAARRDYVSLPERAQQRAQARLEQQQRFSSRGAVVPRTVTEAFPRGYAALARESAHAVQTMRAMQQQWTVIANQMTNNWNYTTTGANYVTGNWTTMGTITTTGSTLASQWTDSMIANTSWADEAYWGGWNYGYETRAENEAALEARREREREAQREHRARIMAAVAEAEAADARARELLLAHLDAQQKRDVLEHGWFEVISDKGRRWRIRMAGYSGNVDLMPEEGELRMASYCAHARDSMPNDDHYLLQKLILEADEDSFTDVANLHYHNPEIPLHLIPDRRRAVHERVQPPRRGYAIGA